MIQYPVVKVRHCVYAAVVLGGLIAVLSPPSIVSQQTGPLVQVEGGKVQGLLLPALGGAVFKGIPYAQPPVGDLRWRGPQPVKSWDGVKQTTSYAAPCAQADRKWNHSAALNSSEDCLYLNVWAPEWPARSTHAVMVWLHGGGNRGGSAMGDNGIEPPFDGASLAAHGVVVVTVAYRLGIFGFLSHPDLVAESAHHAAGAYGLLDQIAALQWVHDNIGQFGGDPNNVTLFGQSAGAIDTTLVVASPLSKGLVQKAISESGTPVTRGNLLQTPEQMQEVGLALAQVLNAPAKGTIDYLRKLPTSTLIAAEDPLQAQLGKRGLGINVGIDGYVVPGDPAEEYRSGKEMPIPMIFGNNGRDNVGQHIGTPNDTPEERRAAVKSVLETYYGKDPALLKRALAVYGVEGASNEVSTYPPYGTADIQLGSDIVMRCAATVLSSWHSAVAPTWEYEFDAGTPAHPPYHSAELDFVFDYLRDQGSVQGLRDLSSHMQQYWTNFAKTGNPDGPGLPDWPMYNKQGQKYLQFSNSGIAEQSALRSAACSLFAQRVNRELNAINNIKQ